jgi:hypothetical protein
LGTFSWVVPSLHDMITCFLFLLAGGLEALKRGVLLFTNYRRDESILERRLFACSVHLLLLFGRDLSF